MTSQAFACLSESTTDSRCHSCVLAPPPQSSPLPYLDSFRFFSFFLVSRPPGSPRVSGRSRRIDDDSEQNPEIFAQELLTRYVRITSNATLSVRFALAKLKPVRTGCIGCQLPFRGRRGLVRCKTRPCHVSSAAQSGRVSALFRLTSNASITRAAGARTSPGSSTRESSGSKKCDRPSWKAGEPRGVEGGWRAPRALGRQTPMTTGTGTGTGMDLSYQEEQVGDSRHQSSLEAFRGAYCQKEWAGRPRLATSVATTFDTVCKMIIGLVGPLGSL